MMDERDRMRTTITILASMNDTSIENTFQKEILPVDMKTHPNKLHYKTSITKVM